MPDRDPKPIDFLSSLSPEELAAFQELGYQRSFRRGEAIFREGDDPGGVVVTVSGRVKVAISGVGGREGVLTFLGTGELIGELSALRRRPLRLARWGPVPSAQRSFPASFRSARSVAP